jgi:hypothetical protein
MKTLSFVKQALAVALLISASQATAMVTFKKYAGKLGSGVKSVLTAHETAAAWVARKALGCKPASKVGAGEPGQSVLSRLEEKGWAGQYRLGKPAVLATPEVKDVDGNVVTQAVHAQPAVPGGWEDGVKGIRSIIAHVNTHGNKYVWATRAALLAAIGYGAYSLYNKYYGKTAAEVTAEENKEDAEPTTEEVKVVVVEETTAQPAPVKKSAQSRVYNPAA